MSIFGSLKRFLVGGPATSKTTSDTTTTQSPYAPTIAPINSYLGKVGSLYGGGAPQISDYESSAYGMLRDAVGSSGGLDAAQTYNNDVLSGKYLTPDTNPYLADIAQRAGGMAGAGVNATFGGHGRTGSGLHAYYSGKGIADAITDLLGRTYATERGYQGQAAALAPGLHEAALYGPQVLAQAGKEISMRPFTLAGQEGDILSQLASLGGTSTTHSVGKGESRSQSGGILSRIGNSFLNKLFPL